METVDELRKPDPMSIRESIDEHESYGMISISHASCSGKGMQLFGSSIRHDHVISLEIHHAERTRDKYTEHYFPKKSIVSVYLSPSQFTGLLTRSNSTGVPCTISYQEGLGNMKPAPFHEVKKEMLDDVKEKFKELGKTTKILKDEIEFDLKGHVSATSKEKIKSRVLKIHHDISSNIEYLMKCQIERLERVGNEMVAEAEARMNDMIKQAGLDHLKSDFLPETTKVKLIRKTD